MNLHEVIKQLVSGKVCTDIVQEVKVEFDFSGFGWTNGGCFAFAEAITAAIPNSELWVVATKEEDDWASQHAVIKYQDKFYDAEGFQTEKDLLTNYGFIRPINKLGKVKGWVDRVVFPLWYPEQEFVKDEEIKAITVEMQKLLSTKG